MSSGPQASPVNTMRELLLLRHAKSNWDQPGIEDHERALNQRGEAAAAAMGGFLQAQGLGPDLVLCSTARRAVQTWQLAGERLDTQPRTVTLDALYLAEPRRLLDIVRRHGDAAARLLVVGHNPGLHQFATRLCGTGDPAMRTLLAKKFPTAGLARIGFDAAAWAALPLGSGALLGFWRPRDLAAIAG